MNMTLQKYDQEGNPWKKCGLALTHLILRSAGIVLGFTTHCTRYGRKQALFEGNRSVATVCVTFFPFSKKRLTECSQVPFCGPRARWDKGRS